MTELSVDEARKSRLISPSPPLFPSLKDTSPLPITHLNGLTTYLSDWKADRRHARRPQPPTPARMATKNRPTPTAIPGPAFATSRRLTSMQKTNKSCLIPLLSPEKARRPSTQRRSVGTKTEFPPSSYHLPSSILPRSESLLTDFEEDGRFERMFDSPGVPCIRPLGLPRSQTTPALLSPNKDIASHSLLKPIGPPLPRSITYNDMSTAQTYSDSPKRIKSSTVKVCFAGEIIPEISDVQNSRIKSPYPQTSDGLSHKTSRLQVSTSNPPPHTTDGSAPNNVKFSCNPDTDPRFVYAYELSPYWTGRYISLLDRLRTGRFISPRSSKNAFARGNAPWKKDPKPNQSAELSRVEVSIEKEAMKILRSFCQTNAATESFEHFEYLIRREHFKTIRRSETVESCDDVDVPCETGKISNSKSAAALDNPKTDRRILSGTLPRRMFRKASFTLQQQPRVQKSATVGDLCNPQFYVASNSSSEGPEAAHGSIRPSVSAVTLQNSSACRPKTRTLPEPNDRSPRIPLDTPSCNRLNVEAARNFSRRDTKQTATFVDGGTSLYPISTKSTEETSSSAGETMPRDSSRRFRKSDSLKQLVDHSIKGMKKMGKRRMTSGTTDGGDGY